MIRDSIRNKENREWKMKINKEKEKTINQQRLDEIKDKLRKRRGN